jgi:phospholipase C
VFDHTSVGQFLEKRFGVTIPAISPWHRAVCGDLTSAFDFANPEDRAFPALPDASGSEKTVLKHIHKKRIEPPKEAQPLMQETGVRPSRALPYRLDASAKATKDGLMLSFDNQGTVGAVFHVYDRLNLDQIPRRYTLEAKKSLADTIAVSGAVSGAYDVWILGPNGFHRAFSGDVTRPEMAVSLKVRGTVLDIEIKNLTTSALKIKVDADVYGLGHHDLNVAAKAKSVHSIDLKATHNWYDVTVSVGDGTTARLAGRIETGAHGVSDPVMGIKSTMQKSGNGFL